MNSFLSSKPSSLRLLLASAAILLATRAPAAQPPYDPQGQAREIIAPKPIFAAARPSERIGSAAASAQGNRDFDAQAQARRFISAKPYLSTPSDSTPRGQAVSAQGGSLVDAQEQARRSILAKPNFARLSGPTVLSIAKRKGAREASARSNQSGIGSSE